MKKKNYNPGIPIVWWGDWGGGVRWSSCASVCASLRSPYAALRACGDFPPPTTPLDRPVHTDGSNSSVICVHATPLASGGRGSRAVVPAWRRAPGGRSGAVCKLLTVREHRGRTTSTATNHVSITTATDFREASP